MSGAGVEPAAAGSGAARAGGPRSARGGRGDGPGSDPAASASQIRVLYRDAFLLAVDKPAGLIVHGDGTGAETLTDRVRSLLLADAGAGGGEDPGAAVRDLQAVQRLDRDTTGIVLFSLNKAVQPALDRLVAERRIEKTYLAAVAGDVPWRERELDWPIGRDRHDARRMRVSPRGKPARTRARAVGRHRADAAGPVRTLLEVDLLTGRKHQIRVHLAHAGHPILGDALYGAGSGAAAGAGGLMLHAWKMSFRHPVTGERMAIEAPVPARFRKLFRL